MRRLGTTLLPVLLAACNSPSGSSAESSPAADKPAQTAEKAPVDEKSPAKPEPPTAADLDDAPDEPRPVPTAEPEVVTEVAGGFNHFGIDLYRKVATDDGNIVISPASVALALTMTQAGARANTSKEMQTTLHYSRAAPVVQTAVATMLSTWNKDSDMIELSVVNRLFGEKTVPFEKPFLSLTQRFFQAPLEPVDFKGASEPARVHINDWVAEQTHDRIKDLIPAGGVTPATRLALVNAIYFKASWMYEFAKGRTAPAPFFTADGSRDVPTMHLNKSLAIQDAPGATVVHLDYQHPGYAMTLVVPTERDGLGAIEASLGPELLGEWTGVTKYEQVELSMPKFRITSDSIPLGKHLQALGIVDAFGGKADFTGIAPASEAVELSEVFHKGFIEVDESGTEAAAATAVVARAGSAAMPQDEPRVLKVDRPFLYLIRDKSSGLVLFLGRVTDPKTE